MDTATHDRTPPPLPESSFGLTWRPLQPVDAAALMALRNACEEADGLDYRSTVQETMEELSAPEADVERQAIAGFGGAGRMVAFGWAQPKAKPTVRRRVDLWGAVHPAWRRRKLGTQVLRWSEARGRQFIATMPERHLPAALDIHAHERPADRLALAERHGFRPIRHYFEMRRALSGELPLAEVAAPLRIVGWSLELDEQVRLAHNEAFRDHWGSEPIPAEVWRHVFTGGSSFRADLSFVVLDGGEVAGYSATYAYPADYTVSGIRDAWIGQLGVRRPWRRRGLASALIGRSLRTFLEAGLDHGSIGVDAENPSGALGLYERLGFRTFETSIRLAKDVDGPESQASPPEHSSTAAPEPACPKSGMRHQDTMAAEVDIEREHRQRPRPQRDRGDQGIRNG